MIMVAMFEVLVGASFALCLVYVSVCVWRRRKQKVPPGPEGYLFCGNSFQINTDKFHQDLQKLSEEYGPIFKLNLYGKSIISLSSPALINEAFGSAPSMDYANDRAVNSTSDIFYGRKHMGGANLTKTTQLLREIHSVYIPKYFENEHHFEIRAMEEVNKLLISLTNNKTSLKNPHTHLRRYFKNICSILVSGPFVLLYLSIAYQIIC